jgi:hypothetical protein
MYEKIDAGTISSKEVNAKVAILSQSEKRARIVLRLFELQVKHKGEQPPDLLLSDGSMINHGK